MGKVNPQTPGTKYRDVDGVIRVYGPKKTESKSNEGGSESGAEQALSDRVRSLRDEQAALLARQRAEEDAALTGYGQRVAGLERPDAIYSRLEAERGVPEIQARTKAIRQRIADIDGLLSQLPEDVTRRVAGTLTTSSQRNRIVAKEQAPLAGQIAEGSRELGVESGNLADAMAGVANLTNLTIQGQERELEPERIRISLLSDRAARELTAFNSDRESELNLLSDKLQRTRTLSDQEWARANALADQATQFENTKNELIQRSQLAREEAKYGSQLNREEAKYQFDLDALKPRGGGGGTAGERALGRLSSFSSTAESILNSDRNQGEAGGSFTTIAAYREAKNKAIQSGINPGDFDEVYSSRLSPYDRITYGIGSTTNYKAIQEESEEDPLF